MSTLYPVKVFASRGSEGLAEGVFEHLRLRLPEKLQVGDSLTFGKVKIDEFSNDNILVQVENVRDHLVIVIHTQVPPVDKGIIELFHLLDALNNARAADILLVFPYMPYARSDRKNQPRISTMGYTLPHILTTSFDIRKVLLLDPHDSHLKHYFNPAADEISAIYLLIDYLEREVFTPELKRNSVVVFSDAGAARRFSQIPEILKLPEAYMSKQRSDSNEKPEIKTVVGQVKNKFCLLVDDEILTGSTAIGDAKLLLSEGANLVSMLAVHAILAQKQVSESEVIKKLEESPIERFVVTDTVPVHHKLAEARKFTVISVTKLLAEAIKRTILGESLTALHNYENVSLYR